MGLKDLLVYVDNDPACDSRVDVAAALAVKHEAHLTGLHTIGLPPFPGYVEVLSPNFLDEQCRLLNERARPRSASTNGPAGAGSTPSGASTRET
jgi:hypothetical protein